ncbi:hypothetical protein MT340_010435 [Staphylococcus sp. NRL 16/872]|uniref:hypothetical protein n=1 Tax=Staphylococcus sp. NRL 16/872 TaxID=2930131 RepID=UPI001FB53D08|nr:MULTISPECIES: hypothetical protein [unclassified Staphylococcus]MCJ1656942.1 hypothetical protein [Staphylococcus sp. NRL 21/187]MCJ1662688.1 hypothetical protein [Staphylococcus sp. NRL 18/288]MCJ1668794.1 hypothetical protein [Staphylococcus sp. NRL 19/737]WEN69011.1 hypothetical protein MT340_010435 [Staphylococcus sp. NRL 16/872]
MTIYVLINIAIVLGILGFDLYRHRFKHFNFSSVLIAIIINGFINIIVIEKFNFIALCSIVFFLCWLGLQYYLKIKGYSFIIEEYKSIALIFAIIISCSLLITFGTSDHSVYMSVPYLAPTIFIIGAVIIFSATFNSNELEHIKLLRKFKYPIMTGHVIILISIVLLTLLTPFWYVFVIIYLLFGLYILWQLKFLQTNHKTSKQI